MSIELKDKEKMIQTCQAILNTCEKSFVWEDDTYEHDISKKPFSLFFPHPQIETELYDLFENFSGTHFLFDQIKIVCTLDEEWFEYGTYGLDRDFTRYLSRYTLKPEYAEQVKAYFSKRLEELQGS